MTRKLQLLSVLSIALFYSTNGFTAETTDSVELKPEKTYDIEIIVFKNISVPKGHELNLPTPSPTRTINTLNLSNPYNIKKNLKKGFSSLQPEEMRLQDIVQHIIRSSRYDLLSHTGWRQPGLDKSASLPIWIKGGKTFGRGYSSIDQADPASVPQTALDEKTLPAIVNAALYELEGQITITLSRYLHTHANLVLRKPATLQNVNSADSNSAETVEGYNLFNYGINEKRRMRSKKLHYLDHPQFGMLVLITPYEAPAEEPKELTTVETPAAVEKQ